MEAQSYGVREPVKARAHWESTIGDEVKQELARELHDRVAQTLTSMLLDLESFKADQIGRASVIRQMSEFQDSTRDVLNNLRQLLYDLRGEESVGESVEDAVAALLTRFQAKSGIRTLLQVMPGWPRTLTSASALNVYRIIEEALNNAGMHSGARQVKIELGPHSNTELAVVVADDGRGVETGDFRVLGLGTVGMQERALLLGGRLRIDSQLGKGTTVSAIFPKESAIRIEIQTLEETPA